MYRDYGTYSNPAAILPTGETMNPAAPESATYYNIGQTALVLLKVNDARTRPTRVVTTFGDATEQIGDLITFAHDQTGARMGEYKVVGIHVFKTGVKIGDVPNRKINHSVYK